MGGHLALCASVPAGKGLITHPGFEWIYLLVYLLVHQGVLEGVLGFIRCCLSKIQKCKGFILEEFLLTSGRWAWSWSDNPFGSNQAGSVPLWTEVMVLGTQGHGRLHLKYRVGSSSLLWFEQVAVPRKYLTCPAGPPGRVVCLHLQGSTSDGEAHAPFCAQSHRILNAGNDL